jgi:hypothetical protein
MRALSSASDPHPVVTTVVGAVATGDAGAGWHRGTAGRARFRWLFVSDGFLVQFHDKILEISSRLWPQKVADHGPCEGFCKGRTVWPTLRQGLCDPAHPTDRKCLDVAALLLTPVKRSVGRREILEENKVFGTFLAPITAENLQSWGSTLSTAFLTRGAPPVPWFP